VPRVVIVEDNRPFRETLELLPALHDEIEVVGSVDEGAEAVELCGALAPEVVLMDYRMPGLDGAQRLRRCSRRRPRAGLSASRPRCQPGRASTCWRREPSPA
jgi:DNA-binding NarL/FixJ family response regulator